MDGKQRAAWREVLARKYPTPEEARSFIDRVGLKPDRIPFQPRADLTWFGILDEANKQQGTWTDRILEVACDEFPDDEALRRMRAGRVVVFPEGRLPDVLGKKGVQLEKIIDARSSLVPVSFLERGLRCAEAVARICTDETFGTGFLIAGDLLVTNHHVLASPEDCKNAQVDFGLQRGLDGSIAPHQTHGCAPDRFFLTSAQHDFTVVKLIDSPSAIWRPLPLEDVRTTVGDRVNVIQHPGGQEKQLSYFHNVVAYAEAGVVQYVTDTLPGSSGSPVFDKNWRVVAVHHSGGWLSEPGTTGGTYFRNEGIEIGFVRQAIETALTTARGAS